MEIRRRAFSQLWLIAAIAVVAMLIGLIFAGSCHCGHSSPEKKTRVVLKTLQGMLEEFEVRSGRMSHLNDQYASLGNQEMMPKGTVADDGTQPNSQLSAALQRTQVVMLALAEVPENRAILEKLPSEMFLRDFTTKQFARGPILLDAWDRPILFAPGRSSIAAGQKQWGAAGLTFSKTKSGSSFQSADGKGVFISAGPDNDFSTGDDNLFSNKKGK